MLLYTITIKIYLYYIEEANNLQMNPPFVVYTVNASVVLFSYVSLSNSSNSISNLTFLFSKLLSSSFKILLWRLKRIKNLYSFHIRS